MAGIGFQLRKLAQRETLSSVLAAGGHAAVIAAGPWLFTILSLAGIGITTERLVGLDALAEFRVVIIYAFAASLVLAAPVTMVATRLVADALWMKRPGDVRPLLMAALATALVAVGAGTLLLVACFDPPLVSGLALVSGSCLVGLIWVVLSFCGAVRDYNAVTLAFLVGLVVSMAGSIAIAILGGKAPLMVWGFLAGLTVTFFGLVGRVLATFPQSAPDPAVGFRLLRRGFGEYWRLALGAIAGTAGVWIDKWVLWFSDAGEVLGSGLRHAPLYDSAMFIASLGIIPALAAFVIRLETDFFDRYQRYYATIGGHGTYGQIEEARREMHVHTLENLSLVTLGQLGISAVLVLLAPVIIEALGLQFRQVSILRYGALGAVFQFIFIACSAMLLFFDRRRTYLRVQILFLVSMAGATLATAVIGEEYYGVGYFAACVLTAFVAYRLADRTFADLNYLTFIGNNPSVAAATSYAGGGFAGRLRRLLGRPA
ncbi:MAG: exopolysaccharide Pel transporter PelG [Hyphomicrobiaceae bacterium]|nr:exopolysaccharide Pel transporter PelG [Hyphomicrobiaceae bacterium]